MIVAAILALIWFLPLAVALLFVPVCMVSPPARRWMIRQLVGELPSRPDAASLGAR